MATWRMSNFSARDKQGFTFVQGKGTRFEARLGTRPFGPTTSVRHEVATMQSSEAANVLLQFGSEHSAA